MQGVRTRAVGPRDVHGHTPLRQHPRVTHHGFLGEAGQEGAKTSLIALDYLSAPEVDRTELTGVGTTSGQRRVCVGEPDQHRSTFIPRGLGPQDPGLHSSDSPTTSLKTGGTQSRVLPRRRVEKGFIDDLVLRFVPVSAGVSHSLGVPTLVSPPTRVCTHTLSRHQYTSTTRVRAQRYTRVTHVHGTSTQTHWTAVHAHSTQVRTHTRVDLDVMGVSTCLRHDTRISATVPSSQDRSG